MPDEITVVPMYSDSIDSIDNAGEFSCEDIYEALDAASNVEIWRDTSGRDIGYVMVWVNGDCPFAFFTPEEALAEYMRAIGRA